MRLLRCAMAFTFALAATAASARSLDDIRASGKLVVASEGAFPPFNFFEGAKLSGFEIDVAEEVAKRLGVKAEWRTLGFDALLTGLRQDRFDVVIASFAITPEREAAVTFTAPHYCSGGVIVAKDPALRSAKHLQGKVVAVQTGTTYLQRVQALPGVRVKNFPRDTDARSALVAGRTDAWVTDRFVAKRALDADPKAGLHLGDFVYVERVASAVQKGNAPLARAVDGALAAMLQDGAYERISRKWFGEDIRCR